MSVAALAVLAGGVATAASASAQPAQSAEALAYPGPGGSDDYHGGHDRPLRFGPFEFPRYGTVSGGFTWGLKD
ncbi:hypothetical protein C3489_35025 [Streptomyces sp. Ru71]|nr:hypothetical protein C3489_35025 [Streptomyces sp. Ru71]